MKKNYLPIAAFAVITGLALYGIFWGSQVYLPRLNAEKVAAIQAQQAAEAEAAAKLAAESAETEEKPKYDYTIPVDTEAVAQEAAAKANDPDSAIEVTTDENGDVWITRDWSNAEGLNVTEPPDTEADQSPAKANIAGEAGEIPTDESGVYYETFPEATGGATGGSAPAGASGSGTPSSGSSKPSGADGDGGAGGSSAPSSSTPSGGSPGGGSSGSAPSGGGSGTPKNGDVKYVDGQRYVYNSIFGWVQSDDNGGQSYSTPGSNAGEGYYGTVEERANF